MKILIVGHGNSGKEHIKAILSIIENVRITCLTNYSEHNKDHERVKFIDRKAFNSLPQADDKYDLTLICSSTQTHQDDVRKFSCMSNLIIVEKPLSYTIEASKYIFKILDIEKKKSFVFLQRRLHPAISELKNYIKSKELGNPLIANIDILKYKPSKNYMENSLNLGIHYIDLLFFLLSIRNWDFLDGTNILKENILGNILTSHALLNKNIVCRTQFNFVTKCGLKRGSLEIHFEHGLIKIEDKAIVISKQNKKGSNKCNEQLINLDVPLNSYKNAWKYILTNSNQYIQMSSMQDCLKAEEFIHGLAGEISIPNFSIN